MEGAAEPDAAAASTSTAPPASPSASPTTKNDSSQNEGAVSARRAKAMSIGNAASLFGASGDEAALLFGGAGADTPNKPASTAQSPFDAIGEESEEPVSDVKQKATLHIDAQSSEAAQSPSDTAAALFGDAGQTPVVEWLGGASSATLDATNDNDASNLFASAPLQQQNIQDPSLYASGQFGDAQYGYDYSAIGQEAYGYQQQDQQQYGQYADPGQQQEQYAQYTLQAQQQQAYGQYEKAAVDNFNQNMYYDPVQQQQYQQSLQAQAHAPQASMVGSERSQVAYDQQQYSQYGDQNASPAAGQDQYAAYYAQQPYSAQQLQQQPASAYQAQGYLAAQQSYQIPYSAPAGSGQTNQLAQSRTSQAGKAHYAPAYSQTYDPYAPTSDPYTSQQSYQQGSAGHSKQSSISSSKPTPNIAGSSQSTAPRQQTPKKEPKLNRSASSFFAELPPMPAKLRPAFAVGARAAASSVPPMPSGHQQAMPPPPPKSKSPAQHHGQQRPPSRVKSAQPTAVSENSAWSPSMSGLSHSRPGSRTSQRQGSFASTSSNPSQPDGPRSSFSQSMQHSEHSYDQPSQNGMSAYGTTNVGQLAQYGSYQPTDNSAYGQQWMTSPSMSSRQSLDSNRSYHGQQGPSQAYPNYAAGSSQSRPQSRTSQQAYTSPSGSQGSALPPAKRVASRNMQSAPSGAPASTYALSPKQQSMPLQATGSGPGSDRLGLSDEDGMETLMDSFSKQRIGESEGGPPLSAAEASYNSAIKIPLPASEPDTEARILSPHQGQWSDLPTVESPGAQAQKPLSPLSGSVPLLSVSMPSPEVDKKPRSLPADEHSITDSQTQSSENTSEMLLAEEELVKAEQEIKMEEDEIDEKPGRDALAHSKNWAASHGDSDPYGVSTYQEEESKPSSKELQRAWSGDAPYESYSQVAPNAQYQDAGSGIYQQDSYGQPDNQEQAYSNAQHAQPIAGSQHVNYDSYGAYGQQSNGAEAMAGTHETSYGHQEMHPTAAIQGAYGYAAPRSEDAYAPNSLSQASNLYQPYQSASGTDQQMHSTGGADGHQRLQNRPAIPIASFGFNGKLVTFFPSSSAPTATASYGMYEQAGSSIPSIKIQKLADVLPTESSGLDSFPGPLFMDTGSTSASGKAKKKKDLVTWLTVRIDESQQERNYLGPGANEDAKAKAEQKTIALQLLKSLLEHDGKLTGTPQIDQLVQQTLVPHLITSQQSTASFAVASDLSKRTSDAPHAALSQATSRDLDTLQMHLLKGEKREAVNYALNNRLYTHALVIASGTDKSLLAEVVKDFLAFELSGSMATGREPLKVAYSLLAGSGSACIHQFVSLKPSIPNGHGSYDTPPAGDLYASPPSRVSTPSGRSEYPSDVSIETLKKWQETAAMIIANSSLGDQQALTSLGEVLAANGWYKAAHVCYLLSPLTSTLGGPSVPGVRWSLIGAPDPLQDPFSANDLEAIVMTEIIEFAFSLVPVPKGQEAYIGLPHLQAYRVLHARHLADTGHHSKAQKYCDAIGATLKLATKRSPFYHPTLLAQVKDLSDRLSMVSFQDKAGSWISRKVQRPTIDNVWSTLESRFAKFVTGEGEEDPAEEERKRKARDAAKGVVGPFAHYSSITPQGPEGLSRNGSHADLTNRATPPPQPTSVPNTISSANTTKATHHRRSSSYAYGPYGADPYGNYVPQMPQTTEEPEQQSEQAHAQQASQPQDGGYNEPQYGYVTPQNDSGWWSNSNGGQEQSLYGSSSSYGQAPTFSPVTEGYGSEDAQGLMSPMGFNQSPNMTSQNFQPQPSKLQQEVSTPAMMQEEDDDLGLGNSSARQKRETAPGGGKTENTSTETDKKAEALKKEEAAKQAASGSGSWLGRIFRREGSASPTTGPIRAKLGEETSFVYDPVEKRWVNKKVGSDTPPPAATPPPPRAQTASPAGYTQPAAAAAMKSGTPPPPSARPASAAPIPAAPPARSTPPPPAGNSVSMPAPPPGPSSLGSRPPSRAASVPSGDLPPPPARKPGSAVAKKARSRYVDVFAQEQK